MGVDRDTYHAWGQEIAISGNQDASAIDVLNAKIAPFGAVIVEWGSRWSGQEHGHLMVLKESVSRMDFESSKLLRTIPADRDWNQVNSIGLIQEAIYQLREHVRVKKWGFYWFVYGWVT